MIKLLDNKDCCGCFACVNKCPEKCITMQDDIEGFLYPLINEEKCLDCGLCELVCPVINLQEERKPLYVYAVKAKSQEIREKSSSGGAFTLFAEQIILEKGVVFGARINEENEIVHDYTDTKEGLAAFRGSKYVQSKIGNTYHLAEDFLKSGKKVLFSGTPCQIQAFHLYLKKKYANLLTVDFVCHGVPSPKIWQNYLFELTKDLSISKISDINFRNKELGWRNFSFSLDFINNDHRFHLLEPKYLNLYMRGFLYDLYLRPSCYSCPTRCLKSLSDITLADYWAGKNDLSDFWDDMGISAVFLNTKISVDYFRLLDCEAMVSTYENVLKGNRSIEKSHEKSLKRQSFFSQIDMIGLLELISKFTDMTFKDCLKLKLIRFRLKLNILFNRI